MGTIVRLLAKRSPKKANTGNFNNLYGSVANLDPMYTECKDMLLNTRNLKINIDDVNPIRYFICKDECFKKIGGKNSAQMSTSSTVKCKDCARFLNKEFFFTISTHEGTGGGFVTKTSSFVISDDLHVIPNNPASTLGILESSGIKDFAVLEENTLKLGSNEILDLLQCSFLSKTPLSDIFFGKKWINPRVPTIRCQTGTQCTDAKKMTVKVFVQKSNNKILLAHSSEDFINFLFSLLTIPLGRVISLMNRDHESPLSIENIHQSILELNVREYLKSDELKNMLPNPKLSMHYLCSNHIFPLEEETDGWVKTPDGQYKKSPLNFDNWRGEFTMQGRKGAGGFLAGPTKFMVTDDLVVTPLSSISCFMYLHSLKVTPSDIEEQVISIGMEEALNLLRASLRSTSVLTDGLKFFLSINPKQESPVNKCSSSRLLKKPKVEN